MEPTKEQSARLKEVQFEILKTFIDICEKENLTYWLVAGTALGAVRHKGFIPWDDDIDVGMPRPDYERFMEIGQNLLPEYYFLQNYKTDPNYPINFAKIRDNRTTYIETSASHIRMNHGIWMDIFPVDGGPAKGLMGKLEMATEKIVSQRIGKGFNTPKTKKPIKAIIVDILGYIMHPSLKGAVEFRERLNKKHPYDFSEKVINYNGAWGIARELMDKVTMGKGYKGVFEGKEVMLPTDYDKYLTTMYGDYMTPPPVEKQVGHHYVDIIDTENPYTKYV